MKKIELRVNNLDDVCMDCTEFVKYSKTVICKKCGVHHLKKLKSEVNNGK